MGSILEMRLFLFGCIVLLEGIFTMLWNSLFMYLIRYNTNLSSFYLTKVCFIIYLKLIYILCQIIMHYVSVNSGLLSVLKL